MNNNICGTCELFNGNGKDCPHLCKVHYFDEACTQWMPIQKASKKYSSRIKRRAQHLMDMDKVVRSVTDEENGVFDSWLMYGLPDGSTFEDCIEYASDDEWYKETCMLWSAMISHLICNGDWSDKGYTLEFYNPKGE